MTKTGPAQPDVLDRIRSACKRVAERARFVRIEQDQIPRLAVKLLEHTALTSTYDLEHHFLGEASETLAYIVTLDAVNFGSGWFPHLAKRPGMSGYFTIASSLADHFRADGPLDAEALSSITPRACAGIFGQDMAKAPIAELMALFARAWNDLGRHLLGCFDGRFERLIEAAGGSAARLVEIVSAQPLFRDVATYAGFEVPLFKRAQILASDLALAFDGAGFGRLDDLDRLTIFADNLVPHVLRLEGALTYDADLLARIERGVRIEAGSVEEIEIRACAVRTVACVADHLKRAGRPVTERCLDIALWTHGQHPDIKEEPRHRTRTPFY